MIYERKFWLGTIFGGAMCSFMAIMLGGMAAAQPQTEVKPNEDSQELATLYDEDQADRAGKIQEINLAVLGPRDKLREARLKTLYASDKIRSGKDYYRAAMILQHAGKPEAHLLAHEFCVVALSMGERKARWLAAATEDRFLVNIGRPQRFGTQFRSSNLNQPPFKLQPVDPNVTDGLRRALEVPTLEGTRALEAKLNEK